MTSIVVQKTAGEIRTWLSRTGVPLVVAVIVGWGTGLGIHLSGPMQALVTNGVGAAAALAYGAGVHLAERRWPRLSVLLGSTRQPAYTAPAGKATK